MKRSCKHSWVERSVLLAKGFSEYSLHNENLTLNINPYHLGMKVRNKGNKFTKKVMASAAVGWSGFKTIFCWRKHLKSNSMSYLEHLKNYLMPATKKLYPNKNFMFTQYLLHLIAHILFRTFYEKDWNPDLSPTQKGYPLPLAI